MGNSRHRFVAGNADARCKRGTSPGRIHGHAVTNPRIRACSPASQATSPPIGAQSMRNRPRKSVSGGITAQIAPCKRTSERCAKAPCNWPINMELSRHDIGTCKGRSGRRAQRRRAGRRSCNDARARAATKAVELHREARVGRPGERGGAIFFHGSSSWHEDRLDEQPSFQHCQCRANHLTAGNQKGHKVLRNGRVLTIDLHAKFGL